MVLLVLSILASIAVWTFLYSFKFAIVIIASVFIHEYGHFYWMGREGITKKDMFFMPPFGAVARAKEPWTSYGAELRIALAGPTAGLLSVLLFYVLWLIYPNKIFLASITIAAIINLFNLMLPVAVLDGGRVIKSILYSIHRSLGDGFYLAGFLLLGLALVRGYLYPLVALLVAFFLYREWIGILYARRRLKHLRCVERAMADIPPSGVGEEKFGLQKFREGAKTEASQLDAIVNMKKMNWKELVLGFLFFVGIISLYMLIMYWSGSQIDLSKFQQYFRW